MLCYQEADFQIQNVCHDWFDGYNSQMRRVAFGYPFNPNLLLHEAHETLSEMSSSHKDYSDVLRLVNWATKMYNDHTSLVKLRNAVLLCIKNGVDISDIRKTYELSLKEGGF